MPDSDVGRLNVRFSLWAAGLFGLAVLVLYYETIWSMVSIWSRSDTFAHGFLILPIALWLVWARRDYLASIRPSPAAWVALLIIPPALAWILAWLVDVSVIQQLAVVAIIVVGAWAIMGHALGRVLAFPLCFLFFAVPMGEGLILPMMEFTATSTIWLIKLTGIPVYREGLNFSLPSGNWSVVEACSGVRYIIASVTVGTLYAYLNYVSWNRRIFFVIISLVVPVFANTLRAYIIVMLGHVSGMTIATGADHLVYGWLFFGVVIFLMFWLGSFFREDSLPLAAIGADAAVEPSRGYWPALLATMALAVGLAALAPIVVRAWLADAGSISAPEIALPEPLGEWREQPTRQGLWRPPSAVGGSRAAYYRNGPEPVGLYIQYRDGSLGDTEVIGSSALFTGGEDDPHMVRSQGLQTVTLRDTEITVNRAIVRDPDGDYLAWSWYLVGHRITANDYIAKGEQAMARLGLARPGTGAYRIVLVTPVDYMENHAGARLQSFLDLHFPPLYLSLLAADPEPG